MKNPPVKDASLKEFVKLILDPGFLYNVITEYENMPEDNRPNIPVFSAWSITKHFENSYIYFQKELTHLYENSCEDIAKDLRFVHFWHPVTSTLSPRVYLMREIIQLILVLNTDYSNTIHKGVGILIVDMSERRGFTKILEHLGLETKQVTHPLFNANLNSLRIRPDSTKFVLEIVKPFKNPFTR